MKKGRFDKLWLVLFFIIFYIPIIIIFFESFNNLNLNSVTQNIFDKFVFGFNNFSNLFNHINFVNSFFLTLSIGIISSIIAICMAVGLSLTISGKSNKIEKVFFTFIGFSFSNIDIANSLSLAILFFFLHISAGIFTLIASCIFFILPYAFFLLHPRIKKINKEFIESSLDLGASRFYTFRKIIFVLIRKNILMVFLVGIAMVFDDFIFSFLNSGIFETSSVYIYTTKYIHGFLLSFGTIFFVFILLCFVCGFFFERIKIKVRKVYFNFLLSRKINNSGKITISLFFKKGTTIFILLFSSALLFFSGYYLFNITNNAINFMSFNDYINDNTISNFSKLTNIHINVFNYETNEQFFSKRKYTKFDLGMVSDYGAVTGYKENFAHTWTQDDKKLFISDFNKFNKNAPPVKDIDHLFNKQIWEKMGKYYVDESKNIRLSNITIPYSIGDLRFLFKKNDQNIGFKWGSAYKKIYEDSINNKNVGIINDARDTVYLGIKIAQSLNHSKIATDNNGFVTFSKSNIDRAYNVLKTMFSHKNTLFCSDETPHSFWINSADDIFANNYNFAHWFQVLFNFHNQKQKISSNNYYIVAPPYDNYNINKINNNPFENTNLWEDGFIISKNESPNKIKKIINFIAFLYNQILFESNDNPNNNILIPLQTLMKNHYSKSQFKLQPNCFNNIQNLIKLNPDENNIINKAPKYLIFNRENEDYVEQIFSELNTT